MFKIGAVQIDIRKAEREFEILNLSDVNVVKWLLMYRDSVDIYFDAQADNHFENAGHVKKVNQELIQLYAALDEVIANCDFSADQLKLIYMISIGYTFKDIEEVQGDITAQNVKRRYMTICKMIAQTNREQWDIWVSKSLLHDKEKQCAICEKFLPSKSKFFVKDKRKEDGLGAICKKCDTNRKRASKQGI